MHQSLRENDGMNVLRFGTCLLYTSKLNLSGGIRYDHRHLHSEADSFRFQAFKRSFEGVTGSCLLYTYLFGSNR